MNIGVIDIESKTLDYLQSEFKHIGTFAPIVTNEEDKLSAIAQKAVKGKYDAIAINLECKYEKSKRTALKGIELTYWLRLKENYLGTILTYGFLTSGQVLRLKPEYVVLHAPGNYHYCLPYGFKELDNIQLNSNEFDINSIKATYTPIIRKMLDLDAIRHKEANWWGIKILWDCHKVYTEGEFVADYPNCISQEMNKLNNFLLQYCYGTSKSRLENVIQNKRDELNDKLEELESSIQKSKESIRGKKISIEEKVSFIKGFQDEIEEYKTYLPYLSAEERKAYTIKIEDNKNEINLLDDARMAESSSSQNEESSLEQFQSDFKKIEQENIFEEIKTTAPTVGTTKELKMANVLLIDDQASDGWAEIYQNLIYGEKCLNLFTVLNIENAKNVNQIKKEVKKEDINSYDFILLDLRIIPTLDDKEADTSKISGIQILRYLRNTGCFCPILITSASNKIWSYQEILKNNADAYWLKEGVDNLLDAESSLKNYVSLKETMSIFCNEEYSFLNEMQAVHFSFYSKNSYWWKNKEWGKNIKVRNLKGQVRKLPDSTASNVKDIKAIYRDGLVAYRNFIQDLYIQKSISKKRSWYYYSSIMIHFAKTIEKIHNQLTDDYEKYGTVSGVLNARKDSKGKVIYKLRNDAAHFDNSRRITFTDFRNYVRLVNDYLLAEY